MLLLLLTAFWVSLVKTATPKCNVRGKDALKQDFGPSESWISFGSAVLLGKVPRALFLSRV